MFDLNGGGGGVLHVAETTGDNDEVIGVVVTVVGQRTFSEIVLYLDNLETSVASSEASS